MPLLKCYVCYVLFLSPCRKCMAILHPIPGGWDPIPESEYCSRRRTFIKDRIEYWILLLNIIEYWINDCIGIRWLYRKLTILHIAIRKLYRNSRTINGIRRIYSTIFGIRWLQYSEFDYHEINSISMLQRFRSVLFFHTKGCCNANELI